MSADRFAFKDLQQEKDWPVIKTTDPERLARFYGEALGFTDAGASDDRITLTLRLVNLVLVRGTGGLQHSPGHMDRVHWWSPPPGDEIVLHLPVFDGRGYLKERKRSLDLVPRKLVMEQDFFFLYLRDPDGNGLCLYRDYHGPYEMHWWYWSFWTMPALAVG